MVWIWPRLWPRFRSWLGCCLATMVLAVLALVFVVDRQLIDTLIGSNTAPMDMLLNDAAAALRQRSFANMPLNGSDFWDVVARGQGLIDVHAISEEATTHPGITPAAPAAAGGLVGAPPVQICHDFFAVWPGDCVASSSYLNERLRALSAQMVVMNSTLHFYTTDINGCTNFGRYSGVRVEWFNATDELLRNGFRDSLPYIDTWDKAKFTRISDILRLCLAYRHQRSYLDTDVHFLQLQKFLYERPYVGAQMWSDSKNAIELTNAAFCLPRNILKDMMSYQNRRIVQHGNQHKFFYTELGPSMFHHVLMNRHSIPFYSQNHPADPVIPHIARDIIKFGHKQLHLTGHVRKGNKGLSFGQLINDIRKETGLPQLHFT